MSFYSSTIKSTIYFGNFRVAAIFVLLVILLVNVGIQFLSLLHRVTAS